MKQFYQEVWDGIKKLSTSAKLMFLSIILVAVVAGAAYLIGLNKQNEIQAAVTASTAPKTNLDYQNGKPLRAVFSSIWHPVHKIMLSGFLAACADEKIWCEPITSGDITTEEYIANMEKTIALGSSGVVMNLGAPVLYAPGEDMVKAGFPVVGVHTPISQTDIPGLTAWVSADPGAYAIAAADEMASAVACKGPVAVMQSAASDTENAVGQGFAKELALKCPGIEVLPIQMESVEPTKAQAVDAAVIAAHADLKGAFSSTGGGPTSWMNALKEAGKNPGDVKVISMDITLPNLDAVKAGWVHALVAQPLFEEFYQAVEIAVAQMKGEPVKYENYLPAPIVKIDGIDKYYQQNANAGNK